MCDEEMHEKVCEEREMNKEREGEGVIELTFLDQENQEGVD